MAAVWTNRILILLAFAGIFVAGTLSLAHAFDLSLPCGGENACDIVSRHPSSKLGGIPIAYFGLLAYAILLVLAGLRAITRPEVARKLTIFGLIVSGAGMLISIALTYVAVNVVHATCLWCLASAIIMTATFFIHGFLASRDDWPEHRTRWVDETVILAGALLASALIFYEYRSLKEIPPLKQVTIQKDLQADSIVPDSSVFLGAPDAPVTIVEFADFLCASCRQSYPFLENLRKQHPGKVRTAYRHYPLDSPGHEHSLTAAFLAEFAATRGKYYEFVDAMMGRPLDAVNTLEGQLQVIEAIGLNVQEAQEALGRSDQSIIDRVYADVENANKIGVYQTPTYVIFMKGHPPQAATSNNLMDKLKVEPYASALAGAPVGQ